MWYLKRGLILSKDNLLRRNWNGNKLCCFCSSDETIQHLFFDCHVAKFLWRVVHYTFDLSPPQSITHLFGNCLRSVGTKLKRKLLTGASALCWAIWLSRNDIVFDRSPSKTYMQVLYRGTHWLMLWTVTKVWWRQGRATGGVSNHGGSGHTDLYQPWLEV